jgi:mannosyl-oligosaccharide glucosidase
MQTGQYTPQSPPDPAALFALGNAMNPSANVLAFQKSVGGSGASGGGKWGFDVFYESVDGEGMSCEFGLAVLTVDDDLTHSLADASTAYDARFVATFPLPAPYNTPEHTTFAQALTANLIGGIGYYQGSSIIDRNYKHDYDEDEDDEDDGDARVQAAGLSDERELLTATPSRSFFPRGFYWDEGFHLALIGEWDNDLRWVAFTVELIPVSRYSRTGSRSSTRTAGSPENRYWEKSLVVGYVVT